jgi:hypothetical protein
MQFVRYRIRNLNREQNDVLNCHQILKNRYLHTGAVESEVEFADYKKHYRLEVLPKEDAFTHERCFDTDYPCNQSWERPIHFLGTTTYCNLETKGLLSTAGYTTRPKINFRYKNTKGKIEAVSEYLVSEVTSRVKTERKVRRAWRNVQGIHYVDPYLAVQTDTTEEETDWESDMDENPSQVEEIDTEIT